MGHFRSVPLHVCMSRIVEIYGKRLEKCFAGPMAYFFEYMKVDLILQETAKRIN